jgi:hypothetical protein
VASVDLAHSLPSDFTSDAFAQWMLHPKDWVGLHKIFAECPLWVLTFALEFLLLAGGAKLLEGFERGVRELKDQRTLRR